MQRRNHGSGTDKNTIEEEVNIDLLLNSIVVKELMKKPNEKLINLQSNKEETCQQKHPQKKAKSNNSETVKLNVIHMLKTAGKNIKDLNKEDMNIIKLKPKTIRGKKQQEKTEETCENDIRIFIQKSKSETKTPEVSLNNALKNMHIKSHKHNKKPIR